MAPQCHRSALLPAEGLVIRLSASSSSIDSMSPLTIAIGLRLVAVPLLLES